MTKSAVHVTRDSKFLQPNQSRVLLRPFNHGDARKTGQIIGRILALPEEQVARLLEEISASFCPRHQNLHQSLLERCDQLRDILPPMESLSAARQLLIGSCFVAEYSVESAALFNPSIVRHPDQSGLPAGALRFVLSLRATGEGHISSMTFRTGIIHPDQRIEILAPSPFLTEPRQIVNPWYDKPLFERKLGELNLDGEFTRHVMDNLSHPFALDHLREVLRSEQARYPDGLTQKDQVAAKGIWMLARSNFEVEFQPDRELSERVLFPVTPSQRNGIEDARFVCFRNEDGSHNYYATFTAYDGRIIVPELVETPDFLRFRFITLNGPAAINKGMALFPRKIGGRFAMLSRQDNESNSIMFSDNIHFWNEHSHLLAPAFPWEIIQLGNCGSPVETEAGWLVLSHGVGPMREYCIGAFLLDLEDPTKVLGRLREPLLKPNAAEREGYVPNVVYTCGFLVHQDHLIIPYGLADHATGFASVPMAEVLSAMEPV
jgi:predicted GH43/DUF377 family glycosyl hydrolase